ncbi:hypothetical protein E0F88_02475 [Dyadobacter psychrotolerans]|uniref:Transposase (putative) YhgA-like domain-containing protein n=1 Tax=Dyadobacter psychrotolerans TaxID=2541721 RepID=A0A4R5DV71_9BACT|nr:hypothetical protein E0F88_02475 [Dyadobacter psychrotolerans]
MSKLSTHDNFIRSIMSDKNIARDYFMAYLPSFVADQLDFEHWSKVQKLTFRKNYKRRCLTLFILVRKKAREV